MPSKAFEGITRIKNRGSEKVRVAVTVITSSLATRVYLDIKGPGLLKMYEMTIEQWRELNEAVEQLAKEGRT